MNVAVVGSRSVPTGVARKVIETLLGTLQGHTEEELRILLRHPLKRSPGPVEVIASDVANKLGITTQWCYPDERKKGRAGAYVRDAHMVQISDMVLALFTPTTLMSGGTGHVVEKAIDKEIPVHAYEVDEDGLRWVGNV